VCVLYLMALGGVEWLLSTRPVNRHLWYIWCCCHGAAAETAYGANADATYDAVTDAILMLHLMLLRILS
jgi:hypothetical protein